MCAVLGALKGNCLCQGCGEDSSNHGFSISESPEDHLSTEAPAPVLRPRGQWFTSSCSSAIITLAFMLSLALLFLGTSDHLNTFLC